MKDKTGNKSFYEISQTILKENDIIIPNDSPLFDQFLLKVRNVMKLESYNDRLEIVKLCLNASQFLSNIKIIDKYKNNFEE